MRPILVLVFASALLFGCGPSSPSSPPAAAPNGAATAAPASTGCSCNAPAAPATK